jgi:opacity protein-like surface antigen
MKNNRGKILGTGCMISLILFLLTAPLPASDLAIKFFSLYFIPSENAFKDIYGNGVEFGGEIKYSFWTGCGIWVSGSYYKKQGELSFTKEKTDVSVAPLAVGLSFQIPGEWIRLYLDGGLGIFNFQEDNPIGSVTQNRLGFLAKFGASFFPVKGIVLDVFLRYSSCRIRPLEIEANIGGLSFGVGLGYRFRLGEEERSWDWKEVK